MIEGLLQGVPNVSVYLDNILITGKMEQDHLAILEKILSRLQNAEIRLKHSKCAFMLSSIDYLGHRISADRLQAPAPLNVTQLRSFLGVVNYYSKFLPNLSTMLAPLYRLLKKQTQWIWDAEQDKAFHEAKTHLTSECLLIHYDPQKELVLSCDASRYGVGAVLHIDYKMVQSDQ